MSHDPRPGQSFESAAAARRRPTPPPLPSRPIGLPPSNSSLLTVRGQSSALDDDDQPRKNVLRSVPSWLMSAVVHMLVLIALGLLYVAHTAEAPSEIELVANWADQLGDPLSQDPFDYRSPLETPGDILSIHPGPLVDNPYSAPTAPEIQPMPGIGGAGGLKAPGIGNNLLGRDIGSREATLIEGGGNRITEDAVQQALKWLVRQQRPDGSWSLSGPFDGGVRTGEPAGATAMALLALQGNGHTHRTGTYRDQVRKGKDFLVSRQLPSGTWRVDTMHHSMYVHGQCTIVLCELYAMTGDSSLRLPAENAVKFCVDSQSRQGGWRYDPTGQDADVSVTGWVAMGLQSAKIARLEVPQTTFDRIGRFLDAASTDGGGRYGYFAQSGETTPAMTAEALVCREWLGWPRDNPHLKRGIDYLVQSENLPRWERWDDTKSRGRDVYYWYYATQALHHYGGPAWYKWNEVIREILPAGQVKSGPEAGSWDPRGDKWGPHGGRLYVTCLSTYILEVYYRHLPIYKGKARPATSGAAASAPATPAPATPAPAASRPSTSRPAL
jgi:hypothetical protein